MKPLDILLVEDNPGDARLTREAFKDARVQNKLHLVKDGVEAMTYLRKQREYATAATPDIVLLDLNLPRKDGREVLAEMKADPELRRIPVVVLTTSNQTQDVRDAYDGHANCFITKPVDLGRFIEVIRSIEEFWLAIARLPRDSSQ